MTSTMSIMSTSPVPDAAQMRPPASARPTTELDHLLDAGPIARLLAPLALPVVPWLALGLSALAALGTAAVAGSERRGTTALGLLVVVLIAVPALARPPAGRFGWLMPGVVRGLEYGLVVRVVAEVDRPAMPIAFGLLCAVAYHHYDTVYRWRHTGRGPAGWVYRLGMGWDGRLIMLAGIVLFTARLRAPLAIAAVLLAAVFLAESAVGWRRWLAAQPRA
jgi:Family of unknown function (DUF5941)